jgi:hypothetical protein
MDDMVKAAMAKWPHVPHCYGWLGLDARGQWFMRDDATQAAGPFAIASGYAGRPSKGSLLRHDKLIEFIHRNYSCDADGCWYFQNGPQRVYVELEAAPYIWRLQPDATVQAHTGQPAGRVMQCWVDEQGRLYLHTELGWGLVHTSDMALAADAVEAGQWVPQDVQSAQLPALGGYVRSPQTSTKLRKPGA